MKKNNNITKIICITIVILITCFVLVLIQKNETENIKINDRKLKKEKGKIVVYFSGAVNMPGIYSIKEGLRLKEILNIIGGIKKDADISKINLAKEIYDQEKIVIPYLQKDVSEIVSENNSESNVSDDKSNNDNEQILDKNFKKININIAKEKELNTLPGIGEITAKKIIEYRDKKKFKNIKDIMNVKGIGESKFKKIKDMITVK